MILGLLSVLRLCPKNLTKRGDLSYVSWKFGEDLPSSFLTLLASGLQLVLGDIQISTSIRYLLYEIDIFDISISLCFQLSPMRIDKHNWPFCEEFLRHFDTFKPILPFFYRYCIRYRLFDISICISRLIMETMLRGICKPIRYIGILPSTTSNLPSCQYVSQVTPI